MNSQELNGILKECRTFARKEIRDQALEADLAPSPDMVDAVWSKSVQLDIPSLLLPEAQGGAGYPAFCGALVLDTLASECAGVASVFAHHFAACIPLACNGSDRARETAARFAAPGVKAAAVVFPAPLNDQNPAISEKNGTLVLAGVTEPVANTDSAGLFCVFAQDPVRPDGITCLLLEQDRVASCLGDPAHLPGLKVNPFRTLQFQDLEIRSHEILGERGDGAGLLAETHAAYYGFVAAMALGAVRTALQKALDYAAQRYQYGSTIIHHQEIQRMLGSMQLKIHMGTSGYVQMFSGPALSLPHATPDPRLTKSFCTDMAMEVILDAIQIHGGYGYMHEYGLEKIMRDVKVLQLLGGSNPHHHVQVIAEQLNERGRS